MTAGADRMPETLSLADGSVLAYRRVVGDAPGVVFLGGLKSDMTGTKATHLHAWAESRGRAFLRFDYSGHGASCGLWRDGTVGRWTAEAVAMVDGLTQGPQVLVGSSMGGWIMCLVALARPERLAGLVGVAAAPDFTEDIVWAGLSPESRAALERDGAIPVPSDYDSEPIMMTREQFADGRANLVLRRRLPIRAPVRLLHGTADTAVPWRQSLALLERLESTDATLTLVKDGDHRLSRPADLTHLTQIVEGLCGWGTAGALR